MNHYCAGSSYQKYSFISYLGVFLTHMASGDVDYDLLWFDAIFIPGYAP